MDTRARKPRPQTLSRLESGGLFWKALAPIGLKDLISIYDGPAVFLRDFREASREQALLWCARWCMVEVCNGGFSQFFGNSTGILAPEAVQGFDLIGARTMVRITSKAMAMLGSPYPRDREKRGRVLKRIRKPGKKRQDWDPFDKLDGKVYAWGGEDRLGTLGDRYVRRHLKLFFK